MDREHLLDDPSGRQLGDCWETGMVTLGPLPAPGLAHTPLAETQVTAFCLLLNLQRLFPRRGGEEFWVDGISGFPPDFGRCRHRWGRVQET